MNVLRTAMIGFFLLGATAGVATTKAFRPPAQRRLVNGAPSVDALLDRFFAALATKDEQAMQRLRVTEQEYRGIIIPGTVKEGEPPRQVDATASVYWWRMLDQKSQDVGHVILERFGGHRYLRRDLKYTKGIRKFGWYNALGEVRLELEDEHGERQPFATGSIAEVNGRYKFIGFNFNN